MADPNPIYQRDMFLNMRELMHRLGRKDMHATKLFVATHGLRTYEMGRERLVLKSAVEAALADKPIPPQPSSMPDMMKLGEVVKRLGVSRASARKFLARHGVPVFRPHRVVALVDRAAFEKAFKDEIKAPTPARRSGGKKLPPWVRSRAQKAAQERATAGASAKREAEREGRTFKKAEPLTGEQQIERHRELTEWGREARAAERAGREPPPVPEVERTSAKPHLKTIAPTLNRPAPPPPSFKRQRAL